MEIDMCECATSFHMRREIFMKRCTEKDCNCSPHTCTLSAVAVTTEVVTEDGIADVGTGGVGEDEAVTVITGRIGIVEDNGDLGMIDQIMPQIEERKLSRD